MKTRHHIIVGDSRKMASIPDRSVHLVVTSPPYWQLKDYGKKAQIGFDDSYESYINNLNLVWNECYRILNNGCRLCINIGDQFARSVYYGRYKVIPIRTEIIKFCETIGFDYMGAIIWQKVTTTNTTGGATIMGSFPYPRNGILKIDYEFILIFKKSGKPGRIEKERKERSRLTTEEWNTYFAGHWNFPGERQDKHLAMFPLELPNRLIKMFTFVGDTVLDPFLGSGTTSLSAKQLNRNSIGIEINEEFLPVIRQKLGIDTPGIFDDSECTFEKQQSGHIDYGHEISRLPYVFRDPVKIDMKIDPKKLQFGSRVDHQSRPGNHYHTVKRVINPNTIELDTGLTVRLLGIKTDRVREKEAVEYLRKKIKAQKVFLKYDEEKYDENDNLLCYLYLKNKTFINAHLIKNGLVDVDTSIRFRHLNNFLHYKETARG